MMSVKRSQRPKKPKPIIILSGFTLKEKEILSILINKLEGICVNTEEFTRSCTHVVCKKPSRSEKFLSACILGIWVLSEQYILKSAANNRWLQEEIFEWRDTSLLPDGESCTPELMKAPKRCRLSRQDINRGLFADWKVGILVEHKKRLLVYKRLLECGDALVMKLTAPIDDPIDIKKKFSHVFVDSRYKSSVGSLLKIGVKCLFPDYIGDFVVNGPSPSVDKFLVAPKPDPIPKVEAIPLSVNDPPIVRTEEEIRREVVASTSMDESLPSCSGNGSEPADVSLLPVVRLTKANLSNVKRKLIPDVDNQVLEPTPKRRKICCDWSPQFFAKFNLGAAISKFEENQRSVSTCLPACFTALFESCFEEDHGLAALDALMSTMSTTHYLQPKTINCVMMQILLTANGQLLAEKSYQVLYTHFLLHPPFTTAMQDIYLQAFYLDEQKTTGNSPDQWSFIKQLFSPCDSRETDMDTSDSTSSEQVVKNNMHLVDFIMVILESDFSYFVQHYEDRSKHLPRPLVARIMWPTGQQWRVMSSQCRELIDILGNTLSDMDNSVEQQSMSKAVFSIIAMVAECCQETDSKNGSKSLGGGERASCFARELMHKLSASCADDVNLLDVALKRVQPSWMRMKVCDLLLDAYDISLLPESCDRSDPLSLRKIVSQHFYLLPPLMEGSAPHLKKNLQALKDSNSSPNVSPIVTPGVKFLKRFSKNTESSLIKSPKKPTAPLIMRKNIRGENQLHTACIRNNAPKLKELLSVQGIDVNAVDNAGWSPLHEACNHGHLECVMELLKYKPLKTITSYFSENKAKMDLNLSIANTDGITPLHDAVANNHVEVAKALLQYGGSRLLTYKTKDGDIPLACAVTEEMKIVLTQPVHKLVVTPTKRRINLSKEILVESQLSQSSMLEESGNFAFLPLDDVYSTIVGSGDVRKLSSTEECHKYVVLVFHLVESYVKTYHSGLDDITDKEDDTLLLKEFCDHVRGFQMHLQRIVESTEQFRSKVNAMKFLAYI